MCWTSYNTPIKRTANVNIPCYKIFTKKDIKWDKNKIKEDYNVTPAQLIDIKALQGDASDCIPGVKGVGEKTARILIEKYESIENTHSIAKLWSKLDEKAIPHGSGQFL